MTRAQKNRLEEFLMNAFLFAFFRKTVITLNNRRRYLTPGNLQVIAIEFIGWHRCFNEVLRDSPNSTIADALQALCPGPSTGQSTKLNARLSQGAAYPRGLIAPIDMEVDDPPNPMLGPELEGTVTKADIAAVLAKFPEPWRL